MTEEGGWLQKNRGNGVFVAYRSTPPPLNYPCYYTRWRFLDPILNWTQSGKMSWLLVCIDWQHFKIKFGIFLA